jgi:two-component sensor histidine kinase
MNFKDKTLRGRYFKEGTKEQLKVVIINLLMILAVFIMIIDVYGSIREGYIAMSIIETLSAITLIITYILFLKVISLEYSIYITLFVISFLFIISLSIQGENYELTFFWLPTLSIHIFFFLGTRLGIKWTIGILLSLIITILNGYFGWIKPLHSIDLLTQITIGYMAISYLMFILERERQAYEDNLYKTQKEKDILLKEVHHRTKNNMQIIISLIDMQSNIVKNTESKQILKSNVDRLKTMSYLHEYLYSGLEYDKINLQKYIGNIIKNIQKLTYHHIKLKCDNIVLDINQASTIALILNETITNSIQHAYNENITGTIDVIISEIEDRYTISIYDYGVGYDMSKHTDNLGMILIYDLSNKLPNSAIEIQNKNGIKIDISFEKEPL